MADARKGTGPVRFGLVAVLLSLLGACDEEPTFYCRSTGEGFARQCFESESQCESRVGRCFGHTARCFAQERAYCFSVNELLRDARHHVCVATPKECEAWVAKSRGREPTGCSEALPEEMWP